jgi:prephenate dehydrogenase
MALVSHLPQLLSCALASSVRGQNGAGQLETVAGRGFRDMTRLAESSWGVWRDICATNAARLADALDLFIGRIEPVRDELRRLASGEGGLKITRELFKMK